MGELKRVVEQYGHTNGVSAEAIDLEWDAFVSAHPCGHLMQTSRWGVLKSLFGWDVARIILKDGDTIVAGAQVLFRSLVFGLFRLAYVPMGPVVDWDDEHRVSTLFEAMKSVARHGKAFCVKLEPAAANQRASTENQALYGCRHSVHPVQWRSTIEIDLTTSEEQLFTQLNKRHRQKIRKASREGIAIRPGKAGEVGVFQDLLEETAKRKQFTVYPREYYRAAYDTFISNDRGEFLVAEYQGAILAAVMVFAMGPRAYCFYGATGNVYREFMPAYLLHWEAIRWAREQGCRVYDYCGVPNEDESTLEEGFVDRQDGLWGVYRFKRGFGGYVVHYVDTCDMVLRPGSYRLYESAVRFLESRWGETWHRRVFPG